MEDIATFLAVTGESDEAVAQQFLEVTGGDLQYAVTLYMESKAGHVDNDEHLARSLQTEQYADDPIRAPDASVHRHETLLGLGLPFEQPMAHTPRDIFGTGRVGIFNQRFDDDENEFHYQHGANDPGHGEDEDYAELDQYSGDSDDIIVIDSEGEEQDHQNREHDQPRVSGRRRTNRDARIGELTSTQRRLASLFRPPFDIMEKLDIDSAKIKGRQLKKWLLVNIQDAAEFQCQVLNRDFWLLSRVKTVVRDNFLFLQYQNDLVNGSHYVNFYHPESFPHIAILDPMTGERVKTWPDGVVPKPDTWLEDVYSFLEAFSLDPGSSNPTVQHDRKFDPDSLSEEQQIEFAMRQLVLDAKGSQDDPVDVDIDGDGESSAGAVETNPVGVSEPTKDPFGAIIAAKHEEPTTGTITRIQIRFPNGQRLVEKFSLENDTVATIYASLKYHIANNDGYDLTTDDRFSLSSVLNKSGRAMIELLDESIGEAGLKNASVILEKE